MIDTIWAFVDSDPGNEDWDQTQRDACKAKDVPHPSQFVHPGTRN
jgi:hypothetical protein